MRNSRRATSGIRVAFTCALLGLSGCVSMEFPDGGPAEGRAAGAELSLEQRWHLRNAAKSGEHELVATVGRMAWDNPQQAGALGNYASALLPDSAPQIQDAVARAVR